MKIPLYARYNLCVEKAYEFLEKFNIISYPIDIEKIIRKEEWGITPYSLIMEELNYDRDTVIRCLRSEDGYTQLDDDNYSIAYNDDPKLGARKRFTLMHEVGHIYLNHLKDFDMTLLYRGSLSKEENKVLENEANVFARNVLVPVSIYLNLKDKSPTNVAQYFGISLSAAQTRINFINTDYNSLLNLNLSQKSILIFKKFINKRKCFICNVQLFEKNVYCSICGNKNTLKWGDGKLNYKEYFTNNDGFLEECIHCKNESIKGNFCHICGSPTKNFCSGYYAEDNYDTCCHSEPLSGNARFCPDCGSESIFYKRKILPSWKIEYEEFMENQKNEEEIEAYLASQNFMTIPDETDEADEDDFPFS